MTKRTRLTAKEEAFVREYKIDLNATEACKRAGYTTKYPNKVGPALLKKPAIKAAIKAEKEKQIKRLNIKADDILKELMAIAFSNGTEFAKIKNIKVADGNNGPIYIPHVELVETTKLSAKKKKAISTIKETKNGIVVESYDKLKALELLGKHIGMFSENVNIANKDGQPFKIEDPETKILLANVMERLNSDRRPQ